MAIRTRAVRPDAVLETPLGAIPYVSDAAFYQAVADAAATVQLAGGEFRVVVQRAPTEFANESVTVAALIEWKGGSRDRVQPEAHVPEPVRLTDEARDAIVAAADTPEDGELEVARFEAEANESVSFAMAGGGAPPERVIDEESVEA